MKRLITNVSNNDGNRKMKSKNMKIIITKIIFLNLLLLTSFIFSNIALARDIRYDGNEEVVYVNPGEPTQITFPSKVSGGFKNKDSRIALEKQDHYIIIFAKPGLSLEGESIIVQIDDKRTYSLRIMTATPDNPRDGNISITDLRPPMEDTEEGGTTQFSKPTAVSELMRHMILVAEFGKQKSVPGYRRSNQYSGETVLHDGTLKATIDEIFMGTNLWGYVLNVENTLDTTQRINPATFRLDGTRAVVAQKWELAPQPKTPEQEISKGHVGKVYIVTKAKRR